jgi:hypothetical protein
LKTEFYNIEGSFWLKDWISFDKNAILVLVDGGSKRTMYFFSLKKACGSGDTRARTRGFTADGAVN